MSKYRYAGLEYRWKFFVFRPEGKQHMLYLESMSNTPLSLEDSIAIRGVHRRRRRILRGIPNLRQNQ